MLWRNFVDHLEKETLKFLNSYYDYKEVDELQEFADKDLNPVKCPEEKEFNPTTKRCVKKCKVGHERNEDFKCKKTKKCFDFRT